jgi:hypothetical protein
MEKEISGREGTRLQMTRFKQALFSLNEQPGRYNQLYHFKETNSQAVYNV